MTKENCVDIDALGDLDISILKKTLREGERHMKYYHSTQAVFKDGSRVKCFDTLYYERVIPKIREILNSNGHRDKRNQGR